MKFNRYFHLEGKHALLSASKYHWIHYDDDKLDRYVVTSLAAQRGTDLHNLAAQLIKLGVKLPKTRTTMNLYVNDAIGFRMQPEQVLYYSDNVFGTTDALGFAKNILRIADLKTGVTMTSENQLKVYAALFCLEYGFKPNELDLIELRIYQNDDVRIYVADPVEIINIMDKIVSFDKRINAIKELG